MTKERILHIWAYQLLRHPLLASRLQHYSYENVRFINTTPRSLPEALRRADQLLAYYGTGGDIISEYLNGPRTLSVDRLGMLIVTAPDDPEDEYEFMLCATHFLGDGMALHTFMNELYTLIGSGRSIMDFSDLIREQLGNPENLPASLEERLPVIGSGSKLASAVGAEEYRRSEAKLIGGQSFPGSPIKKGRHTVVPTFAYSSENTKKILAACKGQGLTVAHAVFSLCNLAWSRRASSRTEPW